MKKTIITVAALMLATCGGLGSGACGPLSQESDGSLPTPAPSPQESVQAPRVDDNTDPTVAYDLVGVYGAEILPDCTTEDSVQKNCYWDADKRGNGKGHSFMILNGVWIEL
jgi:hypothetical protein